MTRPNGFTSRPDAHGNIAPVDSEKAFAALFALGCSLGNNQFTPWKKVSRRFRIWDLVPVDQVPAFFQMQGTRDTSGMDRGIPVRKLRAWWFIYLHRAGPEEPISPKLNRYADAVENLFEPTPAAPVVTLGIPGIARVYVDGTTLMDEGLLEAPSFIAIPITILTGN